jgi:hypothetical protein
MTKDEIIEFAEKAGLLRAVFAGDEVLVWESETKHLQRFAALVAEKATEQANARQNASWALMCKKMVAAERKKYVQQDMPKIGCVNHDCDKCKTKQNYRGARLVLTKDGVIQDGWVGDK